MIQKYHFPKLVAGQCRCQLAVMNRMAQVGGLPVGKSSWVNLDLSTLAATVYYDSDAKTVRLVGSLSLTAPTEITLSYDDVQNGQNPQSATVTVNFSMPPLLYFDTGDLILNGTTAQFIPPSIPVTGLYTIALGNQTLTGIFNYSLQFQTAPMEITQPTPTSLVIGKSQSASNVPASDIVTEFIAANGMEFHLVGGIDDGTYAAEWMLESMTAQS
jgi:hypothetical protein